MTTSVNRERHGLAGSEQGAKDIEAAVMYAIKIVADEAWGIAYEAACDPKVCLAIEKLSDDPEISQKLADVALGRLPHSVLTDD